MKKYLIVFLLLIASFMLGGKFGWHLHEDEHSYEHALVLESIKTDLPAQTSFRASILAGMTEAVESGELDIFYLLACSLIQRDLADIDEFLLSHPIDGKGFNGRVEKAKVRLKELEDAGRCEDKI
jgi:hypothetical protein